MRCEAAACEPTGIQGRMASTTILGFAGEASAPKLKASGMHASSFCCRCAMPTGGALARPV